VQINISYDPATTGSLPAGFTSAIDTAVSFYESHFTDAVTINIEVYFGQLPADTEPTGLGESNISFAHVSYSDVITALTADATTANDSTAVSNLPGSDPISSNDGYSLTSAQMAALNITNPNAPAIDGVMAFTSSDILDYDRTDGIAAGKYDFVSVVEHEISEIMGRRADLRFNDEGTVISAPFELFAYSAPGERQETGTTPAYFSIDGGTTNLGDFNTDPDGDFGDWAPSAGHDSYDAFGTPGVLAGVTANDLKVMDALGWDLDTSIALPTISVATVAGDDIVSASEASHVVLSGTTTNVEDGQIVTISLTDGTGATSAFTTTVTNNAWTYTADASGAVDGSFTIEADVVNQDGVLALDQHTITLDQTAPTIAIDSIPTIGLITASAHVDLNITGTTVGVEDGQTITVTVYDADNNIVDTLTGGVNGNAWTVILPDTITETLLDGTYTVKADVSDAAGNAATEVSGSFVVDEVGPTVTINPIAGDNILDSSEQAADASAGLVVSGHTTDIETGQQVSISLNGHTYTAAVQSDGTWAATLPGSAATGLTGGYYDVTATVENLAGTFSDAETTLRVGTPTLVFANDDHDLMGLNDADGLHEINQNSFPSGALVLNNLAIYSSDSGRGLWVSDGTSAGTHVLKDTNTDLSSAGSFGNDEIFIDPAGIVGNELFFFASDGAVANGHNGTQLWVTDGTTAGTHELTTSLTNFDTQYMASAGGRFYFVAGTAATGLELWSSDGTVMGTSLVDDINDGTAASFEQSGFVLTPVNDLGHQFKDNFLGVGNHVFFTADNGVNNFELWSSDSFTTQLVIDLDGSPAGGPPGEVSDGSFPNQFVNDNGTLVFDAIETDGRSHILKTDGTVGGTFDIGGDDTGFGQPTLVDGKIFFVGDVPGVEGAELFEIDQALTTTFLVRDINAVSNGSTGSLDSTPDRLTAFGHQLLFDADDDVHGRELWISDGTFAGTHMVKDINTTTFGAGNAFDSGAAATPFVVWNGIAFFSARDGESTDGDGNFSLWRTDGTEAGTFVLTDGMTPTAAGDGHTLGSMFHTLANDPQYLYFQSFDPSDSTFDLFKTDGTTFTKVAVTDGSYPPVALFDVVAAVNTAPTDITLDNDTVDVNTVFNGRPIGKFTTVDPDAADQDPNSLTYKLLNSDGSDYTGTDFALFHSTGSDYWELDAGFSLSSTTHSSENIIVQVTDSANNTFQKQLTIHIDNAATDTTPPTVVVSDSDADHKLVAGQTDTITFQFSEEVQGFNNGDVTVAGGTLGTIVQDGADPTKYTATFTPNATDTLSATIKVNASGYTDTAGNAGGASNTLAITGDTKAPAPTVRLTTDSGTSSSDGLTNSAALSGTGDPSTVVTIKEGTTTLGTTTSNGSGVWSFANFTPNLSQGSHTLVVSQTDHAGNTGTSSITFTLDSTAPTVTAAVSPSHNPAGAGEVVVIDLTTSEAVVVAGAPTLTLNNGGVATYDSGASDPANNKLEFDYTIPGSANGDLSVTKLNLPTGASVKDAAGNALTAASAAKDIGIMADTTAPTVTVSLKNDTGSSATDKNTINPTLKGSTGVSDPNTVVTITDTVNSVTTVIGHAVSDNTGAWSFTPTNLSGGAHSIKASATDAAHNTGTSAALNFTLDTASPTVSSFTQVGSATTNATTVVYDLKFSEPVTAPIATNFTLHSSGLASASIGTITAVAGAANGVGSEYKITVNVGSETTPGVDGSVSLDFNGGNTVKDTAGHTLVALGAGSFHAEVTTSVPDFNPASLVVGDFNGDGKVDIAEAGDQIGTVNVLLGDNTGALQSSFTASLAAGAHAIQTADFNGDGKADLAVFTVDGTNTVSVFTGKGDGTFNAPINVAGGSNSTDGVVADVNGDGKADLIVTHSFGNTVSTFLGNGDGTFGAAINSTELNLQNHVIAVDVNGDGKIDLVAANAAGHDVVTMLGNGDGTFQAGTTNAAGASPVAVAAGDFNGDGKIDIAVADDDMSTGGAIVLIGDGTGGYASPVSYAAGSSPDAITVADVNGDGISDLVLTTIGDNKAEVLIGNGDGTFQNAVSYSLSAQSNGVTTADLNGDGRADIVAGTGTALNVLLGNAPAASMGTDFTIDRDAPTVVVSATGTTLSAGNQATVIFQFNEEVQNFTNADVTVVGGTLGTIVQDGGDPTKYTAIFTPAVSDTFTGSIKVNASGYQDLANNAGKVSNTLAFTGDTKAPLVTVKLLHDNGSFATDNISNDVTLSGTGDKNATVSFTLDGGMTLPDTATANSTGAWTFSQLGTVSEGQHTVVVSETDGAGNTGTSSITFTRDTITPTVGSISHVIPDGNNVYGPSQPVIFKVDLSEAVTVTGSPSLLLSNGGKATYSAVDSDLANGHVAFKYVPAAGQDTTDLKISNTATLPVNSIKDIAGNDGSATIAGQIAGSDLGVIDTIKPSSVAVLAHDTGASATDKITNDDGISGTSDALATIVIKEGAITLSTQTADGSGHWSFSPASLTQGAHTFTVVATDLAGNVSATSPLTFTYDTTAPTLLSALSSAATVKSGDTITLTLNFAAADKVAVDINAPPVLNLSSGGTATYVSGSGTNALKFAYTPLGTDSSGTLQINGFASGNITDLAGNAIASVAKSVVFGASTNVTVTEVPAATVSVDGDGNFHAGEVVTIHLHFNESVNVTGAPKLTLSDGGAAVYAAGTGSNDLSFNYTVGLHDTASPLKISSVNLNGGTITGTDGAANFANLASANLGVVIDTTAPVITEKLLHDNGTLATDKLTNDPTLTGTGEVGGTVTIKDGSTVLGTTTVASNGTWTYVPTGLSDDTHNFSATETDLAGNTGATVLLSNVMLDATAPTLTHFGQNGATLTNATSVSYDIQFSETVTGLTTSDFALEAGAQAGAKISTVTAITASHGTEYTVTVTTGPGSGAIDLRFSGSAAVNDPAGNVLSLAPPVAGVGHSPYMLSTGDLNGDGNADIVTANLGDDTVSVLLDGKSQPATTLHVGDEPFNPVLADVNGDGKLDIVAGNTDDDTVSVLLGNGDGSFQTASTITGVSTPYAIALADFDGDGKLDLVTGNESGSEVSVRLGNGDGTFTAPTVAQTGLAPFSIATGDFDGDGKLDMAVANLFTSTVSILLGNGDGTFQDQTIVSVGNTPYSVAAGDINGDGNADLVVANSSDNTVSVLLGNGDGTFAKTDVAVGHRPESVKLIDFDGDGKLDIIAANFGDNTVSILLGNGDGTFQPAETLVVGLQPSSVDVADINGDGKLDIVVANSGENTVSVILTGVPYTPSGGVFTIDKTAPTVTAALTTDSGKSATDKLTNDADITGTAEANATVTLKQGATTLGTTMADGSGHWSFSPTGLTQGAHTIIASDTDAAGNTGSATLTFNLDTVVPTITKVAATPATGALAQGGTVKIVLTGSEALNVTGTPTITLNDGGTAAYTSGSGTTALTFTYTVGAGQNTGALAVAALDFTNGSIADNAGNAASTTLTQTFTGLKIDTTAPAYQSFSVVGAGADGKIAAGETLNVVFHYSEPLKFGGGTPTLLLSDGHSLTYNAAGSNLANGDLSFQTVIASTAGHHALSINGISGFPDSSFTDLAGNKISAFDLAFIGSTGVTEDTSAPTATGAVGSDTDGDTVMPVGKLVTIAVTFSEHINVIGSPTLKLSDGKIATYASQSGNVLNFTYTTLVGETTNGADLKISSLTIPPGGSIKDDFGNAATIASANNLDTGIKIDGLVPTVTGISIPSATPKALINGDTVVITLAVNDLTTGDHLNVVGTPTLQLSNGVDAVLTHTTATSLTFTYTVGDESTTDLKVNSFNFDSSNKIFDDAGNTVTLPSNLASADLKVTTNVFTFKGTSDHAWHAATNWTPNGDPETGSTAIVGTAGQLATISTTDVNIASLITAKNATVDVNGADLAITHDATNAGTLKVSGQNHTITLGTTGQPFTLNNSGTVSILAGGGNATLELLSSTTLTGAGTLALANSGADTASVVSDGTHSVNLTNGSATVAHTIQGSGSIGDSHLALTNEAKGVVNANVSGETLSLAPGEGANAGLMEATGGGILSLSSNFNNSIGTTQGTIQALANSTVNLNGVFIENGIFNTTNGAIHVTDASEILNVTNTGSLIIDAGKTLKIDGAAFNNTATGIVNLAMNSELIVGSDLTVSGGGKISLNHFSSAIASDSMSMNHVTLTNGTATVAHTIQGTGTVGDGNLSITNSAKGIIVSSGGGLIIDGVTSNAGLIEATAGLAVEIAANIANTGTIESLGSGAVVLVHNGDSITNAGASANILLSGTNAKLELDGGTVVGGKINMVGGGLVDVLAGNVSTLDGVTSNGLIKIEDGATLTLKNAITSTGIISLATTGSATDLTIVGNTSLSGANGQVQLGGSTSLIASNGAVATLTSSQNINGVGTLGDSHLTFVNAVGGLVNANSATGGLTIDAAAVTNNATLEATNAGGLEIASAVTNNSLIQALGTNAKVTIESAITNLAGKGTITASGTNAHVDLDNATIVGGKLTTVGTTAAINIVGDSGLSIFDGAGVGNPVVIAGSVTNSGSGLELFGTINNTGTLKFDAQSHAANVYLGGDVTLTGTGHVTFNGGNAAQLVGLTSDHTLDNVANTISGSGEIASHVILHNEKAGIVGALTATDVMHIQQAALNNDGLVEAINGGKLVIFSETIANTSTGVFLASGNGSMLSIDHSTFTGGALNAAALGNLTITDTNTDAATTVNNNGGEIDLSGNNETLAGAVKNTTGKIEITAGTAQFTGTLTNNATIDVLNNFTEMSVSGTATNAGIIHVASSASLQVRSSSFTNSKTITLDAGMNTGASFDGSLINSGTITMNDGDSFSAGINSGTTTINNTGTIAFNGAGASTGFFIGNTVTLTGGGKITFADADHQVVQSFDPSFFTNGNATSGNTISGAATFAGADLHFDNTAKGTVSATFLNHALTFDTLGSLTNEGTFQSSGWMKITNTTLDQSSGTTGVIKTTASGAHIDLDTAGITGGKLTTVAGSTINFENSNTLDGVTATNAGTFAVLGATGAPDFLNLSDHASLSVSSGGHLHLQIAQVENDGTGTLSIASGGFLDVGDDDNDSGTLAESDLTAAFTNAGTITVDAATFIVHNDITNTGAFVVKNHSAVVVDGKLSGGTLNVDATSQFSLNADNVIGGTVINAGTIVANQHTVTVNGAVTNTGTFSVGADGHLVLLGAVSGAGGVVAFDGTASVEFVNATATSNVRFDNVDQQIILDHSASFHGTISQFDGHAPGGISAFFAFGDSTIDSGWFPTALVNGDTANETGSMSKNNLIQNAVDHGGGGDPVGFGLMGSEVLASDFGITLTPADATGGGNNYAISGALSWENPGGNSVTTPLGVATDPGNSDAVNGSPSGDGNLNKNHLLPSTVQQIQNYLDDNAGVASANTIYLIGTGGNDTTFANDMSGGKAAKEAYLIDQADALADQIAVLQLAGADTILVHGLTGDNGNGATATGNFASFFDTELFARLDSDGVDYVRSDLSTLYNAMVTNFGNFGFTAGTVAKGTAGTTQTASAFIDLETAIATGWGQWGAPTGIAPADTSTTITTGYYAYLRAPNAEYTSLYSDDQHFSTQGQQFEANFDLALLFAAGDVTMDSVDLKDINFALGTTTAKFAGTVSGGTLTVTDAAHHTSTLAFAGDYRDYDFITLSDGHGGTDVIASAVPGAHDVIANSALTSHYDGSITVGMLGASIDYTVTQNTTLSADAGGVMLTSAENIISKGSAVTLTNSETIFGGGNIGDNFMTFVNGATGVIDANDNHNGMLIQAHTFTNSGLIEATSGGWLDVASVVGGVAKVGSNGLLEFGNASSANVTFLDNSGTLKLDVGTTAATKFSGTISGFQHGNDIDFADITYTTGNTQLSFDSVAHKLTITDGTHSETLTFTDATLTLASFNATQDITHHVDLLHV
jgi:ELWxxDGT repeat protein